MTELFRKPRVGDYVKPDQWVMGDKLTFSDGFSDGSFPGCDFRLMSHLGYNLAVNIIITGRTVRSNGKVRCKIEFVGDGEPSVFTRGWIKLND